MRAPELLLPADGEAPYNASVDETYDQPYFDTQDISDFFSIVEDEGVPLTIS